MKIIAAVKPSIKNITFAIRQEHTPKQEAEMQGNSRNRNAVASADKGKNFGPRE